MTNGLARSAGRFACRDCTWPGYFAGKAALITGGLGFIGSNLAIRLTELGARVTILDALWPESGANWFNISPIEDRVTVIVGDVRDRDVVDEVVPGQDVIFHAAAQVSHVRGLHDPFADIAVNISGVASLLEAARRHNPRARLIKLGTRGQYGRARVLPVREESTTSPLGTYEWSLQAAEELAALYERVHSVAVVRLRLANIYGPRAQMRHGDSGVVNWFIRLALDDGEIPLFGSGRVLRDFVYIDDCVDAIVRLSAHPGSVGEVFNIGSDRPTTYRRLAQEVVRQAGGGRIRTTAFTPERRLCEPGDFFCAIDKIRGLVGWRPTTPLAEGIRQTIDYYRRRRERYWETVAAAA